MEHAWDQDNVIVMEVIRCKREGFWYKLVHWGKNSLNLCVITGNSLYPWSLKPYNSTITIIIITKFHYSLKKRTFFNFNVRENFSCCDSLILSLSHLQDEPGPLSLPSDSCLTNRIRVKNPDDVPWEQTDLSEMPKSVWASPDDELTWMPFLGLTLMSTNEVLFEVL